MSEPESLDTNEALPKRIERHWFDRLVMLSDGVFAIAMTLLALEVRPPAGWSGGFEDLLEKSWRAFFGYGFSFLIVALFWSGNRSMVARVRRVDGPFSALTLLFLGLICLTPFATSLMAQYGPAKSMKVFAVLVGSAGAVQTALWVYAAFLRDLVDEEVSRGERWMALWALITLPAMFSAMGLMVRPGASEFVLLPVLVVAAALGRARRKLASPRALKSAG